ncbi:unnamed protein product [Spirodela intermedia]|uniref:Uncharacterized protein n=1 Tax=Spirodela intermedia TaxID=51605 RepID=A0A7I8J1Q2_SPIIN|nr:unnamed protein product [Spirodela intermedia]CAA6663989.1 unnamed protein product [Spirodela intermedia]
MLNYIIIIQKYIEKFSFILLDMKNMLKDNKLFMSH